MNSRSPSAPVRPRSTTARVSDAAISLGLAPRRSSHLAASQARGARCVRPTSASHHSATSIRVSWVPVSSRGCPRAEQGSWRFTVPSPLRRALAFLSDVRRFSPRTRAKDRASDTPVASPCMERRRFRTHRSVRGRQDRFCRAFVKRARLHDPERLPSIGDPTSRSAARGVLPPLTLYGPCLSPVPWLCHHDPVLRASSRAAGLWRRDLAVLWPRLSDDARPPFTRARVFVRKFPGSSFSGSGHCLPISATHFQRRADTTASIRSSPAPPCLSAQRDASLFVLAPKASRNDRVPDRTERAAAFFGRVTPLAPPASPRVAPLRTGCVATGRATQSEGLTLVEREHSSS